MPGNLKVLVTALLSIMQMNTEAQENWDELLPVLSGAVTFWFLNGVILQGWSAQDLINWIDLNRKQVFL